MKKLFLSFMHWWVLAKPKIFRKSLSGNVWKMWEHKGWGNAINWFDFEKGKVVGFLSVIPSVGDELQCQMESGKIMRFRFDKIERMRDPRDMFFADMSIIGYKE